ncbi:MAG TPA: hypothetical protein VNT27_14570 [Propionibacteriaceae bacterium]|nr:hypothetical protein [Propionibacteriaceae bacterium]
MTTSDAPLDLYVAAYRCAQVESAAAEHRFERDGGLVGVPRRGDPGLRRARRSVSAAVAVVAVLGVLASCGTSSTSNQTSPPASPTAPSSTAPSAAASTAAGSATAASPAACADVVALRSSLQALTEVKPAEDGVAALTTAITNVKTDLDKAQVSVSSSASSLQPSVQEVKTAFAALQTAASGLTKENLKQKLPEVAAAMKQLRTAREGLSLALAERCPGS